MAMKVSKDAMSSDEFRELAERISILLFNKA
jgi:hypothetical protein